MEPIIKTIAYKGRIVFQKMLVESFTRVPKEYFENEACFIFINQGKYKVIAQTAQFHLDSHIGLLAKCLNYFFESTKTSPDEKDNVEVIGVLFYPELIQDIFTHVVSNLS